jgi:hypothetical protein
MQDLSHEYILTDPDLAQIFRSLRIEKSRRAVGHYLSPPKK